MPGRSGVLRRIHVVKRVDRLVRPVRQRDAMPRRPDLDLAQVPPASPPGAGRRAAPPATARPPGAAIRRSARRRAAVPASARARCSRATRSRGRNGQSPGTLATVAMSGAFAAAQSRPARTPARGPAKSGTSSATTGRPVSAKRAGSPLALRMSRVHCGASRSMNARENGLAADLRAAACRRRPSAAQARRPERDPASRSQSSCTAALRRCLALSSST